MWWIGAAVIGLAMALVATSIICWIAVMLSEQADRLEERDKLDEPSDAWWDGGSHHND